MKICWDEYFFLSLKTGKAACGDGDILTLQGGLEGSVPGLVYFHDRYVKW